MFESNSDLEANTAGKQMTRTEYPAGRAVPDPSRASVKTVVRAPDDSRFTAPLYTVRQVASYLREPENTVWYWVRGRGMSEPLVTWRPSPRRNEAEVPFIGLAEALVVSALRHRGFGVHYIRGALDKLAEEMTLDYALASRSLYHDGARILFRYSSPREDFKPLAEVLSQQYLLVESNLELITFEPDGWAGRLVLPFAKDRPLIEVDPNRAFGKPIFVNGGARLQDVIARLRARDSIQEVADDFGVPEEDVLDILRAFLPPSEAA
ncbi:MAG: DUF433 domain-containing protein [Actinomycetota bacterium]|nr:DUF433 domain-containing protein [Actinomycetota bacterium]